MTIILTTVGINTIVLFKLMTRIVKKQPALRSHNDHFHNVQLLKQCAEIV